ELGDATPRKHSRPNKSDSRSWRKLVMQNRPAWFFWVAILVFAPVFCLAQEATPTASPGDAEGEAVGGSATRFDIPLDQSPATVTVISSEDIEQKQIQRVSDA